jgi:DNA-binding MarR family transcriptional regulator
MSPDAGLPDAVVPDAVVPDAGRLEAAFVGVVRSLGLLRPDTTPCGQPMSITEAHALGELSADGPLTQRDLAARLRLEKSTVSRLVGQLEERGLVDRHPNPADGRSLLVELTALGRKRARRLEGARKELFGRLIAELSPRDRRLVVDGLGRLAEAAQEMRCDDAA